jgi:hypothetical protein
MLLAPEKQGFFGSGFVGIDKNFVFLPLVL